MKAKKAFERRLFLSLFLVFLLVMVFHSQSFVNADWHVINSNNFTHDVLAFDHTWMRFNGLTTDRRVRHSWTTGAVAVKFYIMDVDNYALFAGGDPFSYVVYRSDRTSDDYSWTVTSNGDWYFVWYNPSIISTALDDDWTLYAWWDPADLLFTSTIVSKSVEQGDQTTANFYVHNYGEETGSATLEVETPLPTGMTVSLDRYSVTSLSGGYSQQITATIGTSTSTAITTHTIDVYLKDGATLLDTIQLSVTVTAAPDPADLRFTSNSASASLEQGDQTTCDFYVKNYGDLTGSANVELGSVPSGINIALDVSTISNLGADSQRKITATISATSSCTPNEYQININLKDGATTLDTIELRITVEEESTEPPPPPPGPTEVPAIPGFSSGAIIIGMIAAISLGMLLKRKRRKA